MAAVKITVKKNGPYRVEAPEGSIELVRDVARIANGLSISPRRQARSQGAEQT